MTTALDERRQDSYLSTLCNYAEIADRRNIENEDEAHIFRLMKILDIIPYKDGDQWCALYGENLQEGIAGFGDTPYNAMDNLRTKFHQP